MLQWIPGLAKPWQLKWKSVTTNPVLLFFMDQTFLMAPPFQIGIWWDAFVQIPSCRYAAKNAVLMHAVLWAGPKRGASAHGNRPCTWMLGQLGSFVDWYSKMSWCGAAGGAETPRNPVVPTTFGSQQGLRSRRRNSSMCALASQRFVFVGTAMNHCHIVVANHPSFGISKFTITCKWL